MHKSSEWSGVWTCWLFGRNLKETSCQHFLVGSCLLLAKARNWLECFFEAIVGAISWCLQTNDDCAVECPTQSDCTNLTTCVEIHASLKLLRAIFVPFEGTKVDFWLFLIGHCASKRTFPCYFLFPARLSWSPELCVTLRDSCHSFVAYSLATLQQGQVWFVEGKKPQNDESMNFYLTSAQNTCCAKYTLIISVQVTQVGRCGDDMGCSVNWSHSMTPVKLYPWTRACSNSVNNSLDLLYRCSNTFFIGVLNPCTECVPVEEPGSNYTSGSWFCGRHLYDLDTACWCQDQLPKECIRNANLVSFTTPDTSHR